MPIQKRFYTREFKISVCSEIESGLKTTGQISREHNVAVTNINRWVHEYRHDPSNAFVKSGNSENAELIRLKMRVSELESALGRKTLEVEILQKTIDHVKAKRGIYTS